MTEITTHSVQLLSGEAVSIQLKGLCKIDMYGTNLELTGQGNWFGSMNMCNLLADNYEELFRADSSEVGKPFDMLELGSGLGRAGLMAAKLMERMRRAAVEQQYRCVLTDGEEEVVGLLQDNCKSNLESGKVECSSQQLWWGENEQLQRLRCEHHAGFDLILGADLIYGRDAVPAGDAAESGGDSTVAEEQTVEETAEERAAAVCGFGRDKLNLLLYTAGALLSYRGSRRCSGDSSNSNSDGDSSEISPFDLQRRSAFFLAVTRRELLPLEELRERAAEFGLGVGVLEDYTFDIFNNCVDTESLLWRDTILHLYRL